MYRTIFSFWGVVISTLIKCINSDLCSNLRTVFCKEEPHTQMFKAFNITVHILSIIEFI